MVFSLNRSLIAAGLLLAPATSWAESPNGYPQRLAAHGDHLAPPSTLVETAPLAGVPRAYSGTPVDVLTYHYDAERTGWNATETDLTQASVVSGKFGLLATLKVDGEVLAQPLLVSGFVMPDGTSHDVLVVATGHDSVYAFDAQSANVLWQVSLGKSQSSNDVGCGDIMPEYGISSTPVILRSGPSGGTIYLVAATEPSSFAFHTQLHALDLATGAEMQPAVEISPSATLSDGSALHFDPQNQWSRTGLASGNGSIYVGIGSHCDNNGGNISGWMLRYSPSLALMGSFHTIETPSAGELASIWMSGFAPALDTHGNLFVVTGNGGVSGKGKDWGESAVSLPASVASVRGRFTPSSYGALNNSDLDFGSGGIMLLPPVSGQTVPPLAVAIGKSAVLYLLDQQKLGGLKPEDSGALQATPVGVGGTADGVWGGPSYYDGAGGPTVFLQTGNAVLRGYSVSVTGKAALTQTLAGTTTGGVGGGLAVVSSSAGQLGTGLVWLLRRSAPLELEAYNADALGAPIFSANAGTWPASTNPFITPMQANGRVYVPAYKTVKVFGLTQ